MWAGSARFGRTSPNGAAVLFALRRATTDGRGRGAARWTTHQAGNSAASELDVGQPPSSVAARRWTTPHAALAEGRRRDRPEVGRISSDRRCRIGPRAWPDFDGCRARLRPMSGPSWSICSETWADSARFGRTSSHGIAGVPRPTARAGALLDNAGQPVSGARSE